jgi:hypothetical protein
MAHKRKFIHDGTKVVEVTPETEQAICAEISADAERFREELQGQLPNGKGLRRSIPKWPIYSNAAGVHPDQIEEAKALARQHGINTEYTPDGRAIFRDRAHRKKHCQVFGFFDRSGGYGDASPQRYVDV